VNLTPSSAQPVTPRATGCRIRRNEFTVCKRMSTLRTGRAFLVLLCWSVQYCRVVKNIG